MALPTPESADAALGIDDAQLARIEFADWQTIDGVRYAQRRTLAMGPAIVSFACKKIEVGAKIDAATFEPPAAVAKAKPAASEPAFDKDGKPNYQIVERPAQAVASVRVKCKPSEISSRLGEILPEILTHITSTGGKMAGPPYSRYHAFSDAEIDLEAGIPVAKPITEKGRIKNGELPGGKLVTCWHIGSYEKLTGTHQGLQAHLTAKQFKARGGPWEVYWTDPGMVQDQSKWRTQLFVAIE
jgi:effector-binding domain-containing protein